MIRTFGGDENFDLFITGRSLTIVSGIEAVMQVCQNRAQALLGEMVLAKNVGMPFFQTVFVGNPSTAPWEAAFRQRILSVSNVREIQSLEVSQVEDRMVYSATIVTDFGTATISGTSTNG